MENVSSKSKTTALVLAFFLGIWGAHRFYANKNSSAIIMLILSLSVVGLAVTCVWATIDFFVILAGSFKDNDGNIIK